MKSVNDVNPNNFKQLKHERPQGAKAKSVMNLEVTVDSTPQKLSSTLKDFAGMTQNIPVFLEPEAQIVLQCLFSAFEKSREVREGLLKDWFFGFATAGVPVKLTACGMAELIKQKYIRLQDDSGGDASIENAGAIGCWVRYEKKLLDMISEGDSRGNKENTLQKNTNSLLKDAGLNNEIKDEV